VIFAIRDKKKTDFQKLLGGNHILNIEVRYGRRYFGVKVLAFNIVAWFFSCTRIAKDSSLLTV